MTLQRLISASCFLAAFATPLVGSAAWGWSPWLSEEADPFFGFCGYGNAVSGFRCSGGYCDDISIRCESMPYGIATRSRGWSGWFSEEDNGVASSVSHGAWFNHTIATPTSAVGRETSAS